MQKDMAEYDKKRLYDLMQDLRPVLGEAREAILEIYHKAADFDVHMKADNSPVTSADMASHHVISQALKRLTPEWPVVSEEGRRRTGAPWGFWWLLDPLDGTKEFLQRTGEFTVNLALCQGNSVIAGVVDVPVFGATYWGIVGQGAWRDTAGMSLLLECQGRRWQDPLVVNISRSHATAEKEWLNRHGIVVKQIDRLGSALKFCRIAAGEADLYVRLAPTMAWDTAAGQAVVEAAGGTVRRLTGAPMDYGVKEMKNPPFVATANLKGKPPWA